MPPRYRLEYRSGGGEYRPLNLWRDSDSRYADVEADSIRELALVAEAGGYPLDRPEADGYRLFDAERAEVRLYETARAEELAERNTPSEGRSHMVNIKIKRSGGRVVMAVDAKGLHDVLDAIGVPTIDSGERYADRPRADHSVLNRATSVLSTEVFLRRQYPATFDLSALFNDPPNPSVFQRIGDSAYDQVRKILEHYQPIDISVSITKKPKV